MKSAQFKPDFADLTNLMGPDIGIMVSPNRPEHAGLIINGQVLWIHVPTSLLVEEHLSKKLIESHLRRINPNKSEEKPLPIRKDISLIGDIAEPSFLGEKTVNEEIEEELFEVGGMEPVTGPEFDMGPDSPKERVRKIFGVEETELLELPDWVDNGKIEGVD